MKGCVLNVAYPFSAVSDDTAGGAEQVLLAVANAAAAAGYLSLVCAADGSRTGHTQIVYRIPDGPFDGRANAALYGTLSALIDAAIDEYRVDLVHYHGIDFHEYLTSKDIPILVTLHLPLSWYNSEALAEGHRRGLAFNCVSHRQWRGSDRLSEPFTYIENGVPLPLFQPKEKRGAYTVSMGRICPEKGFHLGIDASKAAGHGHILCGKVYPYRAHADYFRECIVPRLTSRHRCIGQVGRDRRQKVLRSARCLLAPSLVPETSSLAAMEALSCGTPVVAYKTGALVDIVTDGINGFLVENQEQMTRAIMDSAFLDPCECRESVRRGHTQEEMTRKYLDLYETLIRGSG